MNKKRTPMSEGLAAHIATSAAAQSISSGVFSMPEDVAGGISGCRRSIGQ